MNSSWLVAQTHYPLVTFQYQAEELGAVLEDLSTRYDLRFSYSPDRLPLHYRLTAQVTDKDWDRAIEVLFHDTPIKYAFIGNQIVLRADAGQLSMLETTKAKPRQTSPLYDLPTRKPTPREVYTVVPIKSGEAPREIPGRERQWGDSIDEESLAKITLVMEAHERDLAMEAYEDTHRLAQISLLPYLGTNHVRSDVVTNKVSVNVLWGTSKAVDGFELGGFGNTVLTDVRGVQIAGMFNQVGGRVTGTQIAGLFNQAEKRVIGTQLAGIGNIARDSVIGSQIGGVFSTSGYHVNGLQLSGLFNVAQGDVNYQISGIINRAETVHHRQVGLINICDSTAKAPYGLFNFVRQGYNRIEVGSSENMFVTLGAKFGSPKLYNIIQLGLRWDETEIERDGRLIQGTFTSWSVGYGLGFVSRLGAKTLLNSELIAAQVNEQETWTDELNLHTQLRLLIDWKMGGRWSFYFGPTANLLLTERVDPLTGNTLSVIPYEPFWQQQEGPTHLIGWVGFTAGLRI
ncbi:MAG: hypothetical protein D6772_01575 [Bacteroidetes bacterium]|nr:MAG: hypothetical protein D6772_01575 [Bacteroidota bacterium]